MKRELTHDAALESKPRKRLMPDEASGIDTSRPLWQLRAGDYRIFYDVDIAAGAVVVQRVLHKGRKTTREILR